MSLNSERYLRAIEQFGRVVAAADPPLWDARSPCTEWTARDVAGHVIAIQRAIVATIAAERAPMNPMRDPGRHAGADPGAAWREARVAIEAAFHETDVLARVVSTWRGEVTVDDMLGYNIADTTIHAWDLARAVGGDDRLDTDLVEASLAALEQPVVESMRAVDAVAAAIRVPADADAQQRLLAMMGRTA